MKVGERQTLEIGRISDFGLYLKDEEGTEVLLPNRYVSLEQKVGDKVEVFVYHDSEDRIVATTETPKIMVGQVAYLKVVDRNVHGAFLDWGLTGKDLFLPNRNQQGGVQVGRSYSVYMYVDDMTGRCVATMKFKPYVNNDDVVTFAVGQKVECLVVSESEIGYRTIVENRNWGMIYRNQVFRSIQVGQTVEAYVRRITDDRRIDLELQRHGYTEVRDASETLLDALRSAGGCLPLTDRSTPEEVYSALQMSKKTFKRALGVLMSHNKAVQEESQIRLTNEKHR